MPNNIVKLFSERTGLPVDEVEKKWDEAKKLASESGHNKDEESFYPITVSILKKLLHIKEETDAGDIPVIEKPMREPDCTGPYGHPCFTYEGEKELPVGKILDGKAPYSRWMQHVPDEEIIEWAKKYPFKSFYIRKGVNGAMMKVR